MFFSKSKEKPLFSDKIGLLRTLYVAMMVMIRFFLQYSHSRIALALSDKKLQQWSVNPANHKCVVCVYAASCMNCIFQSLTKSSMIMEYTTAKQPARGQRKTARRRKSHVEDKNNNEESEEPWFNNAQGITQRSSHSRAGENCQRVVLDRNN